MLGEKERKVVQQLVKKERGIDYELHPVCQRCIYRHMIEKKLDFEIRCNPLPADYFDISNKSFDSPIEEFWYRATLDPDFYARNCCGIETGLRNAQKEILFCKVGIQ